MKSGVLVGLDIGSTVVKAAAFGASGRLIACATVPTKVSHPRPGEVERDPEATWRAAAAVLRSVSSTVGSKVKAIGVTGCGNGAVVVDGHGRVLRPGILSGDSRAAEVAAHLQVKAGFARAYAGQTACILRWMETHESATLRRARALLFWKDFIRMRLTGEICTDYTDAGASGLLDAEKLRWRSHHALLPPLKRSTEAAGCVIAAAAKSTGFQEGTPVFAGTIDCEATAIGSGISEPGDLSVVAGTWSIHQTYASKRPKAGHLFLCNPSAHPGRWLLMEGGPGSAVNFNWAVQILLGGADLVRGLRVAAGARHGDLLFIPGVSTGQGTFSGLDAAHRKRDLLRAVIEGGVYSSRSQIETLQSSGRVFTRVRFAGGASRSALWCQVFADGLGLPLEVPRGVELGAMGAALCAGVGAGYWASLSEAQRKTVRIARTYLPDPRAHEAMTRSYRRYQNLTANLRGS